MSERFTVITTIQSPGNEPVEMKQYSGTDRLQAVLALGSALALDYSNTPFPVFTLSARIDVDHNWCDSCSDSHEGYCDARVQEHIAYEKGRCQHGFSLLGRCPEGCDELSDIADHVRTGEPDPGLKTETLPAYRDPETTYCEEGVAGCRDELPHEHPEYGGRNRY